MRGVPLLATVALVPLILTPGLLFSYDVTPKVAILLLGVSLALLLSRLDLRLLWTNRPARWFVGILACEWVWCGLATALSTDRTLSLTGGMWRRDGFITQTGLLLFAVLCLAWLLEDAANLRKLRQLITAVAALISFYTICQYFGIDPLLPARAYQAGEGPFTIVLLLGTLGHADYLAMWLLFAAFCSPVWMQPLTLFALILTGTRSALLGLLLGGCVTAYLYYRQVGGLKLERRRMALSSGLGVLVLLAVFIVSPAGAKLRARVHWSLEDVRGGARLLLWRDTIPLIASHPFTGIGPETFGLQFPLVESVALARAYPDFFHESPHNVLLDLTASQGLPAAIAFMMLCLLALRSGWRSPPLVGGFAALFTAHLFVAFTVPVEMAFYTLLAMLVSQGGAGRQVPRNIPSGAWFVPVRIAQYVLAGLLLIFTVRLVAADYMMAEAQKKIANDDVGGAAHAYHASLPWLPYGGGVDLAYSREMAGLAAHSPLFRHRLEAWQEAFESGVRATEHSEQRQNAWYNLAELLATKNDAAGMEHSLRNAIAWSPNWFKPHWILAQLFLSQHRLREALAEGQDAVDRDGGRDLEVSDTLTRIRNAVANP